ncbi:aa3-type cytochrome oxidase subunit III [Tessaracoccus flavescens]|uniref:cytochrome-c oxidase n=1 Tax=Tessaracoccus flavescens TaxID=399497 RepID=A0A1Q2CUQ2_9ACTN|nr:cytochrome B [Tessaracoccus flavescens]
MATNHETLTAPAELPSGAIHKVPSARLNKPAGRPDTVSVGVIVWLASELMFFGAVFAAYFWTRSITNDAAAAAGATSLWATESAHLDVVFASINTAILVLSSVTCQIAANAAEARRVEGSWLNPAKWGMRQGFIVTIALGSIFVAGQVWEYFTLFNEGFTIQTNQYWSLFFLATGFHGLHVIGGVVAMWYVLARSYMTRTHTHEQTVGAHVVSYYWHFVDVIWILLFGVLYFLR